MKLSIKVFFLTAVMILFAAGVVAPRIASAADAKIGILDLQKAIDDSKKGQKAKADLASRFEGIQKKLKAREAQLEQMKKDIEKQARALSQEALQQKDKELRNLARTFEDEYKDAQGQWQKTEMELTQPVIQGLLQIAKAYGKEAGFTAIFELQKSGMVFWMDGLDITAEVVKRFDATR